MQNHKQGASSLNDERGRLSQGNPLQSSQMCGNVEQRQAIPFSGQRQVRPALARQAAIHLQAQASAVGERRSAPLIAYAERFARRGREEASHDAA